MREADTLEAGTPDASNGILLEAFGARLDPRSG